MENNQLNVMRLLKKMVYHLISKNKYSVYPLGGKNGKNKKNHTAVLILKTKYIITRVTVDAHFRDFIDATTLFDDIKSRGIK